MRFSLFLRLSLGLALLAPLTAQTTIPAEITLDPETGFKEVRWPAYNGNTYYLQTSQDLINWTVNPSYVIGNNVLAGMEIDGPTPLFARVISFQGLPTDDNDGDGLSNHEETVTSSTDPETADSDGDGVTDGEEVGANTDPNDPASGPAFVVEIATPPDANILQVFLDEKFVFLGDNYGLASPLPGSVSLAIPQDPESWFVELTNKADPRAALIDFRCFAPAPGSSKLTLLNYRKTDSVINTELKVGVLNLEIPEPTPSNPSLQAPQASGMNDPLPTSGGYGKWKLLPVKIKEVSFAGANYHELKKDDMSVTYSAPHWMDKDGNGNPTDTTNGERNYSVAYTRNTKPKIGSQLNINGLPNNLVIKLRAKGSDGVEVPETVAQTNGNEVSLTPTATSTDWPNTIKYYDRSDTNKAFSLDWEIKISNGNWLQVAATRHQVYLTLDDPVTTLRQETLFYLSAKNADGDNTEAAARDSMYGEFTDRVVTRLDGVQMTYWMNNNMGCTNSSDLLARNDGNGNCQSWGSFFRDMLRIHGINADRIRVWPKTGDSSVIVKDWQFNQPSSGPPQHPYIENLDALDLAGIPGQGNPNPPGLFNGHWITKSGGHYYDPSYGTAAVKGGNIDKKYEDGAFDGFGAQYQNSAGAIIRGIRKNNSGSALISEVDYFLAN